MESDGVLRQHREVMLEYTKQVTSVGARLDAALFKASVICGFGFPVEPNELVPMEAAVVWSWMTGTLIKAQAYSEGSAERAEFLEAEFSKIREALEEAPEAMRRKREELRRVLAPFFEV